jgi:hypothetical protein
VQPTEALARIDQNLARISRALAGRDQLKAPASFAVPKIELSPPKESSLVTVPVSTDFVLSTTEVVLDSAGSNTVGTQNPTSSVDEANEPETFKPADREESNTNKATNGSGVSLEEALFEPLLAPRQSFWAKMKSLVFRR